MCRYLAEHYASDFAQWLLGEAIAFTRWNPTKFPSNFVPDETAILLKSPDLLLHLEFHIDPDTDLPLKMAEYGLRAYERYPDKPMHQVVVYL
jgi:predicted transposase YdaD